MFALFERNLRADMARMGADARAGVVRMAGQRLAELGLTSACDADLRRDTFAAFAEADAGGLLSQRIYGLVVHDQVDWLLAAGLGRLLGLAERLPARDALAMYTTRAAYACHRESEIGSLEPGKLADFTVLDQNPLETEPEQIPGIGVLATVLGGIPVGQSGNIFPGR